MNVQIALSYVPTPHLEVLDAFSDYGFALTHRVLVDLEYASYYRRRGGVFLDNSFHELGDSADMSDIMEAVRLVKPMAVCAPDRIGDSSWTVEAYQQFASMYPDCKIAAAITGKDYKEMVACFSKYLGCARRPDILCLPYKCERVRFLDDIDGAIRLGNYPFSWHLFGYHGFKELLACCVGLLRHGVGAVTVDTAKPLTYAHSRIPFTHETRSGEAERPPEDSRVSTEVQRDTITNLMTLRSWIETTNWPMVLDGIHRGDN